MIDEKEKTLRDFVHEAIVPLIEDVIVKKLYQALEVVASEIKSPRKEWVGLTEDDIVDLYCQVGDETEWAIGGLKDAMPFANLVEAKLKEKNT